MLTGMLYQFNDLRGGTLPERLSRTNLDNTREVDTARDNFVSHINVSRNTFSCQCYGVKGRLSFDDDTIQRHFLTRTDDDDGADLHLSWRNIMNLSLFYMSHIRTDIDEVGDTLTALPLRITFEEFSHLEEQHDEDGLWELCLGTG